MDAHDPVYQQCLEAAKRDYDVLYPEFKAMQEKITALRALVNTLSNLLDVEVDEKYEYQYMKTSFSTFTRLKSRFGPQNRDKKEKI